MNRLQYALCIPSLILALGGAAPATAAVSFEGEQIKFLIGTKPGGGTDATGRLVGGMIGRHLPGKPGIIFQNLPGGGGIKANNYFYSQAKPDGLTVLVGSRTNVSPFKLLSKSTKYNPGEYEIIGGTARLGTLILINRNVKDRLLDKSRKPLAFGGTEGERTGSHAAVWAKEYLGWNVRFVLGYQGTSALLLAQRRGETDLTHNQNVNTLTPLLKECCDALIQLGNRSDDGAMIPRSSFPDVPIFSDLIAPKLDAAGKVAFQQWLDDQAVEKFFALPPKTAKDMVYAHRKAYAEVMNDPKFLSIARNEFGEDFDWTRPGPLSAIVKNLSKVTEEDLAYFIALRKKHGLPVR